MAKVLVFQHVPAEPLGTLDPMLRDRGHRIRYVNFHRNPDAQPNIDRYDALIVLGGPQMPDQGKLYPHLNVEMRCIEQALEQQKPVLGICLGAQLMAYALGGGVMPCREWEIGWYDLEPTAEAAADPLFCGLARPHKVFQWHGYTFEIPHGGIHLASSRICPNQAFRFGPNAYALQFHLELDERLINRWLNHPEYLADLKAKRKDKDAATISRETHELIGQSIELSYEIFGQFLQPLREKQQRHVLPSR
jgi:GMP synthase (glutamine-hydrolysing)